MLVNVLVNRDGLTVFARLGDWGVLGQVDLTLEAVVYGLVVGLRMLVVTLACLLVVCAADPDELLLAFRRISPHSALTATIATRMVPLLAHDARRLAEAQRCRPDGGARRCGARWRSCGDRRRALDRSLDVAAVLEMRGYGGAGRPRAPARVSRHDLAFAAVPSRFWRWRFSALRWRGTVQRLPAGACPVPQRPRRSRRRSPPGAAPFADRRGIEP